MYINHFRSCFEILSLIVIQFFKFLVLINSRNSKQSNLANNA